MFGCLAIFLIVAGIVAFILGTGPNCLQFDGIQDICLGPQGQFAFIVIGVLCAIGVAFIFGTAKQRSRQSRR